MRSLRPIAIFYLFLLILLVCLDALSFVGHKEGWFAYTDFLSTLVILAITVSILQTEKERKGIVFIAWLTFLGWLGFGISLALPSSAELLAIAVTFLNFFSLVLAFSLFFTRKTSLRIWFCWLGLGLAAPLVYNIVDAAFHPWHTTIIAPLNVISFLVNSMALFILVQKAPGFRRPPLTV